MKSKILGIHHITAMASDAQKNVDFYVNVLGLRFVKKSINQDAPDIYHLYYGDEVGSPGTAITFFPFGHAARGTRGNGEISKVAFAVPTESKDYWISHLTKHGVIFDGPSNRFGVERITFSDPDGMMIELVFSDVQELRYPWKKSTVPVEYAIKRFYGVTMNVSVLDPTAEVLRDVLGARLIEFNGHHHRFMIGVGNDEAEVNIIADPSLQQSRQSAGSVHHIAWRVKDDPAEEEWQKKIAESGLVPTEVIDRFYFHSVYFREPAGILYEIATDNPGFTVDETLEKLGSALVLPPWYEPHRAKIERILVPIRIPGVEYNEKN